MKEENKAIVDLVLNVIKLIFIVFCMVSLFKIKITKAESVDYTNWLTIDGYQLPAWWQLTTNSGSYRTLLFKTSQDPDSPYTDNKNFGYLDVCSNYGFKVSNPSATCNDGCFYNNFNVYNIGQSCVIDADGYLINGTRYFVFFSVKTWSEYSIIWDNLKFEKLDTAYGRIQFNGIVFSTEDLYTNYAAQNRTNELLQAMNTQLHQDNVNIQNSINSQTQQQHQDSINEQNAINGVTNADYNGSTEQPDTTDYDDYEDAEEDLLDNMEEMDLDNVTIAIDSDSSNFVWNTMTRLIQSNALIFSMIISILSVGIIKLMLGR